MVSFVHLHTHSCFSLLDGACDLKGLVSRAAELGMPALALTDHDGLYGAVRFYQACRAAGLKPILGAELTLEDGHHLVLLARNAQGYANLCRLISIAHLGFDPNLPVEAWPPKDQGLAPSLATCHLPLATPPRAPALPASALASLSDGLLALSGCPRGEIPSLLLTGRKQEALSTAERYRDLFGPEGFFIELQSHLLGPQHDQLNRNLIDLANTLQLSLVATNDVHYLDPSAHQAHDVLVCMRHLITVYEPHPERKRNAEYYLKSPAQMQLLFPDCPQAVANTLRIAEACELELDLSSYHFPHFPLPAGESAYSLLCKLCLDGARRIYNPFTPQLMQRLNHELTLINELGFAEYFLVCWDIVRFARSHGIRCSGRGSAAGSLVCYVLGLTDVDPLAHANLIFERFLSREHSRMPDIDLDFDSARRDEVISYVYNKYGHDHVAAVCTLNTFRARSALREVGKALDLHPIELDRISKTMPYIGAERIEEASADFPEVRDAHLDFSDKQDLLEITRLISGFPRHLSVHVGGLVISREPLTQLVPLQWAAKGIVISQFDKDDIEALGLVKMDLLGLRIHTAIAYALQDLETHRGLQLDLNGSLPLDDEPTFELIRSTHTIGLFQLESPGQRNLLGRSQPECYEDLIAEISLFRPGPVQGDMITPFLKRRRGLEPVEYLHPLLGPILKVTYGVMIYQEQILQIVQQFAGLSLGEADKFRRAMTSDRSSALMQSLRETFIKGTLNNGIPLTTAEAVWEQVASFAAFGFCKAHACCFAKIAYQTAYLKAHFAPEFFAGLLSAMPMGYYPAHVILAEAKRLGIPILPPDANRSFGRFTIETVRREEEGGGAPSLGIRVGLAQLKGMSERALQSILAAREQRPFDSLQDFLRRTSVPRPVVENLILVGAFDCIDPDRRALLWQLNSDPATGSLDSPLTTLSSPPSAESLSDLEKTRLEMELLGLWLTRHPLSLKRDALRKLGPIPAAELRNYRDGDTVRVAGIVISRNRPPTRSGQTVIFISLEDETGVCEVVVFPAVYEKYGYVLYSSTALFVTGKLSRQGKLDLALLADHLQPL